MFSVKFRLETAQLKSSAFRLDRVVMLLATTVTILVQCSYLCHSQHFSRIVSCPTCPDFLYSELNKKPEDLSATSVNCRFTVHLALLSIKMRNTSRIVVQQCETLHCMSRGIAYWMVRGIIIPMKGLLIKLD